MNRTNGETGGVIMVKVDGMVLEVLGKEAPVYVGVCDRNVRRPIERLVAAGT